MGMVKIDERKIQALMLALKTKPEIEKLSDDAKALAHLNQQMLLETLTDDLANAGVTFFNTVIEKSIPNPMLAGVVEAVVDPLADKAMDEVAEQAKKFLSDSQNEGTAVPSENS